MKKLFLSTLAIFILIAPLLAQNNIWSLPPNYYDVTNASVQLLPSPGAAWPTIPSLGYNGLPAQYSHNAMQDAGGNLLFFIVDDVVYDKTGHFIGGLTDALWGAFGGGTETMIVPDPGDCQRYYIFTSKKLKPTYTILDFNPAIPTVANYPLYCDANTPGCPNSQTIPMNINLVGPSNPWNQTVTNQSQHVTYAASKVNANNERFIYVHLRYTTYILKANTSSFLEYAGAFNGVSIAYSDRGEMELVELPNDEQRIAYSYYKVDQKTSGFWYMDIDPLTGLPIAGTDNFYEYDDEFAYIHGIEFSPNGDYLYIAHDKTAKTQSSIDFYEIGVSTSPNPVLNIPLLDAEDFENSEIEMGLDGNLYFAGDNDEGTNSRLATFSNPNTPSSGVWNNNALSFAYYFNNAGPAVPQSKTYLLPDQIDGMDYSTHLTVNPECCSEYQAYDVSSEDGTNEYSLNTTWTIGNNPFGIVNFNTPVYVKDNLTIKSGAIITITGMKFHFAPNARLIIEDGAKLYLNSSVLTSDSRCGNGTMWWGVEVWGQGLQSNQYFQSGWFVSNNSIISNAMTATANYKNQLNSLGTPSIAMGNNGGLIQLTDVALVNNRHDVIMQQYQSWAGINGTSFPVDDQSFFVNTNFTTSAQLNNPSILPYYHVLIENVSGILFSGCKFSNTAPVGTYAYDERGMGIVSNPSKFKVINNLQSTSKFTNLYRGILAYAYQNPKHTAHITNSSFNNIWRGVSLNQVEFSHVSDNTFDVGSNVNLTSSGTSFGLFLDGCPDFKVAYNAFSSSFGGYLGVGVNNSGVNYNEIYKNTFNELTIGTQASEINGDGSSENSQIGLVFKCNNYTDIKDYDILVSSGKVQSYQGFCYNETTPANNQFSYTAQHGDYWLKDAPDVSINSTYRYSNSTASHNLAPRTTAYGFGMDYINLTNTGEQNCLTSLPFFDEAKSCPVKDLYSGSDGGMEKELTEKEGELESLLELLNDAQLDPIQKETIEELLAFVKTEISQLKSDLIRSILFADMKINNSELSENTASLTAKYLANQLLLKKLLPAKEYSSVKVAFDPEYIELVEMITPPSKTANLATDVAKDSRVGAKVSLYPNPAKEQFNIVHNLSVENGVIILNVYDLMGRTLINQPINNTETTVNTSGLKTGVYFYAITQNSVTIKTDKLLIE